jgi:hypothetical protein
MNQPLKGKLRLAVLMQYKLNLATDLPLKFRLETKKGLTPI